MIYDWFTEGFDTKDLQEAKALLGEFDGPRELRQKQRGRVRKACPISSGPAWLHWALTE